jgi:hypothetical protein
MMTRRQTDNLVALPTILGSCTGILVFLLIEAIGALSGATGQVNVRLVPLFLMCGLGPWILSNHLVARLVAFTLRRLRLEKLWQHLAMAWLVWTCLTTAAVVYLLGEQRGCDSVCLGLEEPFVYAVPLYAVIIATAMWVGLLQGWALWHSRAEYALLNNSKR